MKTHLGTLALLLCSGLAGAAPPDGGITALQASIAGKVIGVDGGAVQLAHPAATPGDLPALQPGPLQEPLTADAAVRMALRHNPGLQATLGREGRAISDATASPTPARLRAQQAITALSAQAFKAWVNAVAAARSAELLRQAQATAQTSDALTRRMVQAGNASRLVQAQSQATLSSAALDLLRAEQAAFAARETLIQLMGLWGEATQFTLPAALPDLPAQALDLPDVEARVVQARSDLQQAALQWQRRQQATVPDSVDARWDAMGEAAMVRGAAVQLRSQARTAYFRYRSSWDIAQHLHQEVLPLRQFIHDELVLRYNGMLASVFELLADRQTQTLAQNASVLAQRDFWLAHADLQTLLAGTPLQAVGADADSSGTANATGASTTAQGH